MQKSGIGLLQADLLKVYPSMIFVIKAHCGTEYRSIFKRYLSFLYCRHVISHHLLIIDIVIQRISERDFEIGQFFFKEKTITNPF